MVDNTLATVKAVIANAKFDVATAQVSQHNLVQRAIANLQDQVGHSEALRRQLDAFEASVGIRLHATESRVASFAARVRAFVARLLARI